MGTHYRAGQRVTAALFTTESVQVEDAATRTTTGTGYGAASGGAFSAAITVPASGNVLVTIRSTHRNSTTQNTLTSWSASGSVSGAVYTQNDISSLIVFGTQNQPTNLSHRLTGLSPGELLTVTTQHRVTGGTGTYDYRMIQLTGMS